MQTDHPTPLEAEAKRRADTDRRRRARARAVLHGLAATFHHLEHDQYRAVRRLTRRLGARPTTRHDVKRSLVEIASAVDQLEYRDLVLVDKVIGEFLYQAQQRKKATP